MTESTRTVLLELLMGGFFAVACIRASTSDLAGLGLRFRSFLRLPRRIERLRRSRWQWFSMVALMLILRFQHELPLSVEGMALLEFIVFMALPSRSAAAGKVQRMRNERAVANH